MAQASSPEPPLGALLRSLNELDFCEDATRYVSESVITDCRAVASYNWLDMEAPTVVIPGKPPKWTPLREPRQLEPDNGQYFRDPNAARYSRHPIEPAITAVLAVEPEASRDVDVVACGSTLGNLLRFIRGEDKQFRMLVELVEGTMFFIRRENTPKERIPNVRGYGHSFPEAYTTWEAEVKGSVSHQRVISYRFGGLTFLLRHEGDGYLSDVLEEKKEGGAAHRTPAAHSESEATQSVDELTAVLDRNRLSSAEPAAKNASLKVTYGGGLVGQDHIFELKTRSIRRKEADTFEDTFGQQLPRLWVAQIPNFILAYHSNGMFEEIGVRDAKSDIKSWERDHVNVLSRLAALLHHIAGLVKSRADGRLELRHETAGALEVREQLADAGDALSASVRALWAKGRGVDDGAMFGQTASDADEDSSSVSWDEGSEADYTACSEDCNYCGRCSY